MNEVKYIATEKIMGIAAKPRKPGNLLVVVVCFRHVSSHQKTPHALR
jgi:hypothetical protein